MQSTCQEESLRAHRRRLRAMRGGYPEWHREMQRALAMRSSPAVKVGRSSVADLRVVLLRDILGYAFVHVAHLHQGTVYGGFVREMLSGKHWSDIDLKFISKFDIAQFKSRAALLLRNIFGLSCEDLFLKTVSTSDTGAYGFQFHRHHLVLHDPSIADSPPLVTLQIDITTQKSINKRNGSARLPCTLGSTLCLSTTGLEVCPACQHDVSIDEVEDLLRSGRDIEIWPSLQDWKIARRQQENFDVGAVRDYHDRALEKLRDRGYRVSRVWGCSPDDLPDGNDW